MMRLSISSLAVAFLVSLAWPGNSHTLVKREDATFDDSDLSTNLLFYRPRDIIREKLLQASEIALETDRVVDQYIPPEKLPDTARQHFIIPSNVTRFLEDRVHMMMMAAVFEDINEELTYKWHKSHRYFKGQTAHPLFNENLKDARKVLQRSTGKAQERLRKFVLTPPSVFYPKSYFDAEALSRDPRASPHILPPKPHLNPSLDRELGTGLLPGVACERRGEKYYTLTRLRASNAVETIDDLEDSPHYRNNLSAQQWKKRMLQDAFWYWEQQRDAYERVWFPGAVAEGRIFKVKQVAAAKGKKDELKRVLLRKEKWNEKMKLIKAKVRKDGQ